jgi:hypothetical protein
MWMDRPGFDVVECLADQGWRRSELDHMTTPPDLPADSAVGDKRTAGGYSVARLSCGNRLAGVSTQANRYVTFRADGVHDRASAPSIRNNAPP